MYPLSVAFQAAMQKSHVMISRVDVYKGNQLLTTLKTHDAQINAGTDATRRRCDVKVAGYDSTIIPRDASDLLSPFSGNELRLYRGIVFPSGTSELIPLGVFGIADVRVDDSGENLAVSIDGFDRSRKVQRARFLDYYVVPAGTNYATAIQTLINSRVPGLSYNMMTTSETTPQLVFNPGDDPWDAVTKMADAIGAEVFFDVDGVLILRTPPDPTTTAAVWTYAEGPNAMILSLDKKASSDKGYNHVVVTGESTDGTPVRAEAKDDNPASPTYYLGPYGDVPTFRSSPFVRTTAQAQAYADKTLPEVMDKTEELNISAMVNPGHDIGDIVRVTRGRAKVDALFQLTSIAVSLSAVQPMPTTGRRVV